jgi:hypothetical protein
LLGELAGNQGFPRLIRLWSIVAAVLSRQAVVPKDDRVVSSPSGNEGAAWRRKSILTIASTLIAVAGSIWALQLALESSSWQPTCYKENICDGLTFSVAGELLNDGQTPYLERVRRDHIARTRGAAPADDLPFQYPPHALPLFALRSVSHPRAAHAATAFGTTLIGLLLFSKLVRTRFGSELGTAILVTCVSMSPIVAFNAQLGQTGLLAAALVIGVALCWPHSSVATGVLLGLLTFKPQYAGPILIVAMTRGDWRIVMAAAGTFMAAVVVSGLWFGFDEWIWFAAAIREPNPTIPWMVNWMGLGWRLAPGEQDLLHTLAMPVFAGATLLMAAAIRHVRRWTTLEGQLAVVMAWAVLVSPNTHPYDLLVLAPALVYVCQPSRGGVVGGIFLLLTLLTLPAPLRWILILALAAFATYCSYVLWREAESPADSVWAVTEGSGR